MTTKQKTAADQLTREEREMDEEIQRLEAERLELEGPASVLSWDQIQAGEDLDKRERRRGLLPRLITAARIKRLELKRQRHEAEIEPLQTRREKAHARLEKASAKRQEVIEEENAARYEYGDASSRIASREMHIRAINREIRELRGEG